MGRKQSPNKVKETCYMCDMPATSREHVPPQGIFPEQKDLGIDYRKNLKSVPSCNLHNSEKSKEDEYIRFVATIHYQNNPIAQKQFSTKIMRSVRRKPSMFSFLKDLIPATVFGKPSAAFAVDRERFDKEIDHIARALYFLHHSSKLNHQVTVHTPDLFMVNQPNVKAVNERMQEIEKMTVDALVEQPIHGENQDIFFYQFRDIEEVSGFALRLVFFGGFAVIAYASPSVSK